MYMSLGDQFESALLGQSSSNVPESICHVQHTFELRKDPAQIQNRKTNHTHQDKLN